MALPAHPGAIQSIAQAVFHLVVFLVLNHNSTYLYHAYFEELKALYIVFIASKSM